MSAPVKTYVVGGAVRDELLNLPVQDRDWVVVGATPQPTISNLPLRRPRSSENSARWPGSLASEPFSRRLRNGSNSSG